MAVKVVITLEGVEEVKKGLADVTQAGAKSAQAISGLNTTEVNAALANLGIVSGRAAEGVRGLTVEAKNLRQAKFLLKPILEQVGISVGGLGAFAAAARLGILGLAAAAGGATLVALAKYSDNLEKAKRQLDAFGSGKPGEIFDQVNESARRLGATTLGLAPAVQSALIAFEKLQGASSARFVAPEGQTLPESLLTNAKLATKAADALIAILVRGGADFSTAQKAVAQFFDQLGAGKQITADMIQALRLVSEGGVKELSRVVTGSTQNVGRWVEELAQIPINADRSKIAIRNLATEVGKPLPDTGIRSMTDGLDQLTASLDRLAQKAGGKSISQILGAGLATAGTSLEALFGKTSLSDIFAQDLADIRKIFTLIIDAGRFAFTELVNIFTGNPFDLNAWLSKFNSFWGRIVNGARSAFQQIAAARQELQGSFSSADFGGASGFSAPGGAPLAGGGLVRGPGTGTSDSILARLSNFEYVIREAAVRFYGPAFLDAINQRMLPKDFFRGFSRGGMVPSRMPVPGFAAGGLVTAGSNNPITLVIGGETFSGLLGSDDVANRLLRFGRKRNFASAGRAPSRVGLR